MSPEPPRQALVDLARALRTGDKDLFLRRVHADPADQGYLERQFEFEVEMAALKRDMDVAYGKKPDDPNAPPRYPTEQEIAEMVVTINGDQATALKPDSERQTHFVRQAGIWRVDFRNLKQGTDRAHFMQGTGVIIGNMRLLRQKIAKGQLTEEEANFAAAAVIIAGITSATLPATETELAPSTDTSDDR